jgi:hypothetical protein
MSKSFFFSAQFSGSKKRPRAEIFNVYDYLMTGCGIAVLRAELAEFGHKSLKITAERGKPKGKNHRTERCFRCHAQKVLSNRGSSYSQMYYLPLLLKIESSTTTYADRKEAWLVDGVFDWLVRDNSPPIVTLS